MDGSEISVKNFYLTICLEGMLWGFGTAIGELPPYFVSLAASKANKKSIKSDKMNKIKRIIFEYVQKNSFLTILALASIPNPLFDLAGIICGHL